MRVVSRKGDGGAGERNTKDMEFRNKRRDSGRSNGGAESLRLAIKIHIGGVEWVNFYD